MLILENKYNQNKKLIFKIENQFFSYFLSYINYKKKNLGKYPRL